MYGVPIPLAVITAIDAVSSNYEHDNYKAWLRLPAGTELKPGDVLIPAGADDSLVRRTRKLLDQLIEEHAPQKFGPCICDLCNEYAALIGFNPVTNDPPSDEKAA